MKQHGQAVAEMHRWWVRAVGWGVGAALMLVAAPMHAQGGTGAGAADASHLPVPERPLPEGGRASTARVPRITAPLTLADFKDMQPRAELREHLAHVSEFVQQQPRDGQPATEKTEVWMGRTDLALYVVFVCHDRRPASIRAHLARRENILSDDWAGVLLDPFEDRRRGVLLSVNAYGVQADASYSDSNGNPDYSYDLVWDSDGRVTRDGWLGLIALPFRSIRSRSTAPDWGVVLQRSFPRNSESDYWPHISPQISGTLSQEGTLEGMEGATSHNIQLNPYGLAKNSHVLDTNDPLKPFFSNRGLLATAGGEVKAIVKDSIVLDGTINPDFSQVESDAPQFTVNQRFPVYFPELRPFFLENATYFQTSANLLYTRNILNPEFGFRATGKVGRTNIGFLAIDDRAPGRTAETGQPGAGARAYNTVARVSQDIGKLSSVGVIYTDREFGGGTNRIGGFDFIAHLNPQWQVGGQTLVSSTRNLDGSYQAGPMQRAYVQRDGRTWSLFSAYRDISQGFTTQVGFISVTQVRQGSWYGERDWYPKSKRLLSYGLSTNGAFAFDRTGNRVFRASELDLFATLPHNTQVVAYTGPNSDTLSPANYAGLARFTNYSENYGGVVLKSSPVPQLSLNVNYTHGATVNFNPAGVGPPSLLHENTLKAYVTLQPVQRLTVDNIYLLDRTTTTATILGLPRPEGDLVYANQTLRTKINYQFTRALSARAIVEYDSVLANPQFTSLQRTKGVSTQLLMTWLPHPGTAIYLGYDSHIQNLNRGLCNRLPGGECDPNNTVTPVVPGYLQDGRQIFLKASYLFRF